MSTIISTITNSGNTYTYRKYTLGYSNNIDSSSKKYTRLTSITESNAQGDSYAPVKIDWNALQTMNIIRTDKEITGDLSTSLYKEKDPSFFALDINGDGISDIIKQSFVQGKVGAEDDVRLYVYDSQVDKNGNVSFLSSAMSYYTLGNNVSFGAYEVKNNGLFAADIDGDGFNDIVTQYYQNIGDERYKISFQVAFGRSADEWGTTGTLVYNYPLQSKDSKSPISVNMDIDGDGKDEMIFVENHENSSNEYHGGVVCVKKNRQIDENLHDFYLSFEREPKKIFTGDFNNDGLQDIIVMFEHGHKIYYNNGFNGSYASVFTESNSKENYDSYLEDYQTVQQGDFNGDGFPDFLCLPYADTKIQLYINNRDGSFTKYATVDIPISYKKSSEFSINVLDFDGDGKSDVVYEASWFFDSYVQWLRSTGNNFESYRTYYGRCKTEAPGNRVFVGDFNGDGAVELANYGILLDAEPNIFYKDKIHIYNTSSNNASSGNVKSITDGLGIKTSFTYSSATNPSVYTRTVKKTEKIVRIDINPLKRTTTTGEPVNCYTIPLSVVSKMTTSVNNETKNISTYSYADLRIHTAGKGMLGFESFTKNNQTLGTVENSQINEWNTTYWIPKKTTQTVTIGKEQSTKISDYYITSKGNKNYFAYVEKEECTDFDQNKVWTCTSYDTDKGVISFQEVDNDEDFNMYKGVEYFYSEKYGGTYLPDSMYIFQKHSDDEDSYFVVNTYEYDTKGNVTKIVNNVESELKLTEHYTYDQYGNKTSEWVEGSGVRKFVKKYEYDQSGRFLVDEQTEPASTHIVHKYNIYGDLYEDCDYTVSSNHLVKSYLHNGWNETTKEILVDNNYIDYTKAWETTLGIGYYSVTATPNNAPQTKTIYDPFGREVSTTSVGLKGVEISKETTYDSKGQVSSVVNKNGKLTLSDTYTYDSRGRKIKEVSSTGASTTYSYDKRTVKTTSAGRTTTAEYDDWGNIKTTVDPMNVKVTYTYLSNGKPSSIITQASNVSSFVLMKYDGAGNKIEMFDCDAGVMKYTYAADGTILSETDARGVTTTYTYDNIGRLIKKVYKDKTGSSMTDNFEYCKGTHLFSLAKQSRGQISKSYEYDIYGRVIKVTAVSGQKEYTTSYTYNDKGQKSEVTYPGNMVFKYTYDSDGFLSEILYNKTKPVYSIISYDGLTMKYSTVAGVMEKTIDKDGYPSEYILHGKDSQEFTYDKNTGNLMSRFWQNGSEVMLDETFKYDKLDRLTSVYSGGKTILGIDYYSNGNICEKSDVGFYDYGDADKRHALTRITDYRKKDDVKLVRTTFGLNGKISSISMSDYDYRTYSYGPDNEKISSGDGNTGQHVYLDDYEKITKNNVTTEYYFLENDVIVTKKTGTSGSSSIKLYQAVTDNLGSILAVYGETNNLVFKAKYDVWGKQTVYKNALGLYRGYTGHEMLPGFELINMGGRMYDPVVARFLSCDNFVQEPTNSQNFNRYSYCLNNPLKYTDPSGEFFHLIIGAAIGGMMNWMMHGCQWNAKGLGYFTVGAVAGAVSAGVGAGMNVAMAGGNFWTGAAGLAQGVSSTGFIAGMATGASAGFAGGLISGAGNSWVSGQKFSSGLVEGLKSGGLGALSGGITGGIHGGLDALNKGTNFWTGIGTFDLNGACSCSGCNFDPDHFVHKTLKAKYVGKFQSVNVFESKSLGSVVTPIEGTTNNYEWRGVTIPENGIYVAEGVYTAPVKFDGEPICRELLQHEFGHILQYRKWGADVYYNIIAPESLFSAATSGPLHEHHKFWTETYANYLSKEYFGAKWLGGPKYPAQDISSFNRYRLKTNSRDLTKSHPFYH